MTGCSVHVINNNAGVVTCGTSGKRGTFWRLAGAAATFTFPNVHTSTNPIDCVLIFSGVRGFFDVGVDLGGSHVCFCFKTDF